MRISLVLLLCLCVLPGCLPVRSHTAGVHRKSLDAPTLEKDIRAYFEERPELQTPSRVAVVEFGTGEFSRLVRADYPAGALAADPFASEDAISTVMPLSGSSLLGSARSEAQIRLVSSRAQADVLLMVDYLYQHRTQTTGLALLDLTILGMGVVPSRRVQVEALGRATLIDVRNGLVYGVVQAKVESPRSWATFLGVDDALEAAREELHPKLYEELGKQIRAELEAAAERSRSRQ